MLIKLFTLVLICLSLTSAHGQVTKWVLEVKEVRGKVNWGKSPLPRKTKITTQGLIVTGRGSFLKMETRAINAEIVLGPNTVMRVDLSNFAEKKLLMTKGTLRWTSLLSPELKENRDRSIKGVLYTPHTSIGIRGTDFFVRVNDTLIESEIFVLDGRVKFQNLKNKRDFLFLSPGHWAGIGGRFGNSIGQHMDLSEKAKAHYQKLLRF